MTEAFRAAVLETPESEWKPLIRWVESKPYATGQGPRSAMSPTGPDTAKRADYRFLAIREPLRQLALGSCRFPRRRSAGKASTNCSAFVTNRRGPGGLRSKGKQSRSRKFSCQPDM